MSYSNHKSTHRTVAKPSVVEGAGAVDDAAVGAGGRSPARLAAHAARFAVAVAVAGHAHVDDLHGVGLAESVRV